MVTVVLAIPAATAAAIAMLIIRVALPRPHPTRHWLRQLSLANHPPWAQHTHEL